MAIYIKENVAAVPILSYSNTQVEILVLKVLDLEGLVVAIYRPSDTFMDN